MSNNVTPFSVEGNIGLQEGDVLICSGITDPTVGAGQTAPLGSLYLRSVIKGGYLKTGPNDVDWEQVSTIRLYTESFSTPAPNTVSGQNSFAIGEDNSVTGQDAVALGVSNVVSALGASAIGNSANASFPGQFAHAAGRFGIPGDAQGSDFIYRGKTVTQFPIELFLDGLASRLVLVDNSAIAFEMLAIGRRTDVAGDYASFRIEGIIKRDSGAASTAIVGAVNKNTISKTNINLDVNVIADTSNGSMKVTAQGAASQNYNWVVRLITVEEIG